MAMAETAELAVNISLHDGLTPGLARSEEELAAFNRTAAQTSTHVTAAGNAMHKASGHAISLGGGLRHAKHALTELVSGPLGMIGLGVGVFAIGKFFDDAIEKTYEFGNAALKLSKIMGGSVTDASRLLAVGEKFGVTFDKMTATVAMSDKMMGKLAETAGGKAAKGLDKLQVLSKQFGVQLADSRGKALPFEQRLLNMADLYQRTADKSKFAAIAAQVFGRQWANLAPILSLGSKGIKDAAEEADALGVTLNEKTVKDLAKAKEASRGFGEAMMALKLAIGTQVVPVLTDIQVAFTKFLTHGGIQQIKSLFASGLGIAREVGGAIGRVVGALSEAWGKIPAPLQQLLITGFVANKVIKFAFGFSGLDILRTLLGGGRGSGGLLGKLPIVGGLFGGRGGSPANPVWVASAAGGVGGLGGAAGGLSAGGVLTAAGLGLGVAAAWKMLVQDPQLNAQQQGVAKSAQKQLATGTMSEIATGLRAIKTGIADIEKVPGGKELYQGQYDFLVKLKAAYEARIKELSLDSTKHPIRHKAAADIEKRSHERKTLADLTSHDLKRATKEGITEGNRDKATRRDIGDAKLSIGLAVKDAKRGITQVEMAGMREIRGGISLMTAVLSGVLNGGFGDVVSAIGGIRLPAYLDTGPNKNSRRTAPKGPGYIDKGGGKGYSHAKHRQGGGYVDEDDIYMVGEDSPEWFIPSTSGRISRSAPTPRITQFRVVSSVSPRNIDSGQGTQRAYGPTATRAGAAGALVNS